MMAKCVCGHSWEEHEQVGRGDGECLHSDCDCAYYRPDFDVVKPSFGAQDELNTWLNKFDKGHRMVRITIEYLSNQDESHLLPKGS